jgi:rare lipoprotein A
MRRYARGTLRFAIYAWFTVLGTATGITSVDTNITRIARTEPIAGGVSFADRWGAGQRPDNVIALAAHHLGSDSEGTQADAFAVAGPASRSALLQLLNDPAAGVTTFAQRWTAQAEIHLDREPEAAIALASWPLPEATPAAPAFPAPFDVSADSDTARDVAAQQQTDDDPVGALACLRPSLDGAADKVDSLALHRRQEAIVGIASFYDDAQETSSGEQYDPWAFTAAAQIDIRDKFGGVRFGANYQPAYAIVDYEGKKLVVKVNDVGPLRPGRLLDLSRAAMAYFGGLDQGLLPDVQVTPLPLGHSYTTGPISETEAVALLDSDKDRERPTLTAMLQ